MPFIPSAAQINAAGGAMVQLYDNIASGAIASWDVSGISQAYNHLKVVCQARGDTAADSVITRMRFNNDSGANYSSQENYSVAAASVPSEDVGATSARGPFVSASTATANHSGTFEVTVPNYANSVFFKGWFGPSEWSISLATSKMAINNSGGVWVSTSAINRITIFPTAGNFIAGSRLTIYGLL